MLRLVLPGLAALLLSTTAASASQYAPESGLFAEPAAMQASSDVLARRGRGADDGAGHDAGDDKGGRGRGRGTDDGPNHTMKSMDSLELARRGRGADDGAGHDAGDDKGGRGRGRGTDDGPNHT